MPDIARELRFLYERHGSLDPEVVLTWAASEPDSAIHARLTWDDEKAGHEYRLIQVRNIITEVEVIYPDGKYRQVYVSPVQCRGRGGYIALVDVMSDAERRASFLDQALREYIRVGEKYGELKELAGIRAEVERAVAAGRGKAAQARRPRAARAKQARRG